MGAGDLRSGDDVNRSYWENRYASGGDSGAGSHGELGAWKANYVRRLVEQHALRSVIDWGCGDGGLLAQIELPDEVDYIGLDLSATAIARCVTLWPDRQFMLYDPASSIQPNFSADLALSVSVLYHLVEDDDFYRYMSRLFMSAATFVCVYASDVDRPQEAHMRHRAWTQLVPSVWPHFTLVETISRADDEAFYLFERAVS